jgi:hypothetical protein
MLISNITCKHGISTYLPLKIGIKRKWKHYIRIRRFKMIGRFSKIIYRFSNIMYHAFAIWKDGLTETREWPNHCLESWFIMHDGPTTVISPPSDSSVPFFPIWFKKKRRGRILLQTGYRRVARSRISPPSDPSTLFPPIWMRKNIKQAVCTIHVPRSLAALRQLCTFFHHLIKKKKRGTRVRTGYRRVARSRISPPSDPSTLFPPSECEKI